MAEVSDVEMKVNMPKRFPPTRMSDGIATTATRAAIRPYSIIVTPDSSVIKRARRFFMGIS